MIRSYLYAPGSRPDLMAKALRTGADAVILDLEDAVDPSVKPEARAAVAIVVAGNASGRPPVHVRIGRTAAGVLDHDDVRAVAVPGLAALRLPKCTTNTEVYAIGALLDEIGADGVGLYPTIESATGVLRAGELAAAHPRVARLCFGATDFLADIGAPGSAHGPATLTPRSMLVLHSRAAGIGAPVDSVHTAVSDEVGLRGSCELARELGFSGKSVIHPRQLSVVHEVFSPTAAEREWARRVLAAFATANRDGTAALLVDGEFVDPAVVARARALLT